MNAKTKLSQSIDIRDRVDRVMSKLTTADYGLRQAFIVGMRLSSLYRPRIRPAVGSVCLKTQLSSVLPALTLARPFPAVAFQLVIQQLQLTARWMINYHSAEAHTQDIFGMLERPTRIQYVNSRTLGRGGE